MGPNRPKERRRQSIRDQATATECEELREATNDRQNEHTLTVSDLRQRETAREVYEAATRPLIRPPKDFLAWLDTWEDAISNAQQKDVPDTKHPVEWVADFLNVVRPFREQWAVTYKMFKRQDIEDGTLTYRELANDFREEVRSSRLKQGSTPTIAKGAFGPSFADQDDQRAAVDALKQGDVETQAGGKGSKAGKAKKEVYWWITVGMPRLWTILCLEGLLLCLPRSST